MVINSLKNNFYIITGGPGSGKTSLLNQLKSIGYLCVDEVARQIIQEQIYSGGDALHTKNQRKFCDLMLLRSIETYQEIDEKTRPVFFDRGIPELMGYCHLTNIPFPKELESAVKSYRYNKTVFILPAWEEIYQHDHERKQTWEEAVATYHHVANAYNSADYNLVELPKVSIDDRVEFILNHL